MKDLNIAIIGCGLIGNKRAKALAGGRLVAVADTNLGRAEQLAKGHPGCVATDNWQKAALRDDVQVVVVATTNDQLAPITLAAVNAGKHVLVEKPAARNAAELEPVAAAARKAFADKGVVVKVGFNHRFHPALFKAKQMIDAGDVGPLMFLRARYGHGGRKGMETEWRGNPAMSGGGEMLDQGVHLIDLARWYLGDFPHVMGHVSRHFWNWAVDDNGFAILRTEAGQVAFLHATCTEWKNLFSMEIYGRDGKLSIDGLGGSYGVEKLTYYKMLPQMGPPETTSWEYPFPDTSWDLEWAHFVQCIRERKQAMGNLDDALATLVVIGELYRQSPEIVPFSGGH
ncbi:Gfo/Idh/MocA family protein [Humisphaera borealis]|uniref:Gfo/Idh/MocA family oxidoreductase n=1 Tax=Humisphaera borealis TaxID=2807512 RepID=A0A7M2WPH0_9BACT|nr:Gfo/Idh/MocA family oxidoreductase [Humisphaera borealis]QOV87368.1 Gfo/Idh/MocA family oxidoreductase [Humisphaera borealis]